MSKLMELLEENSLKSMETIKIKSRKPTIGSELMNNLLYRVNRRGNAMVEMQGHYIKRVRIQLASNFFAPKEKNFSVWVKPFIKGKYLMFNYNGVVLRASDVFGDGINSVKLN
jgi:hypothetical protein